MSPAPRLSVSRVPLTPVVNGTGQGTRLRHKSCLGLASPAPPKKPRAPTNPTGPAPVEVCQRGVCKKKEATHATEMAELRQRLVTFESGRARRAMEQSVRKEYVEELRAKEELIAAHSRQGSQGSAWRAKDAAVEREQRAQIERERAVAAEKVAVAEKVKATRRVATLEERARHAGEVRVENAAKFKAVLEATRRAALDAAELQAVELERAVEHSRAKLEKLEKLLPPLAPRPRSEEHWARMTAAALRKARSRERKYISSFLDGRAWDMGDWASVLDQMVDDDGESLLDDLWETKEVQQRHFEEVRLIFRKLEREHWGERLGMHCRLELNMTYANMLQLSQAASKVYKADSDFYAPKIFAVNPFDKKDVLTVPRILPPRSRVEPEARRLEDTLGLEMSESGRITHKPLLRCLNEIVTEDMGKRGMPSLEQFLEQGRTLTLAVQLDATGYGKLQISSIVIKNPWASHSAQQLRIFGVGTCDDGRAGATRLCGPENHTLINQLLDCQQLLLREGVLLPPGSTRLPGDAVLKLKLVVVPDLSCMRHCEHLGQSGMCGCSRDAALRCIPCAPSTVAEMTELCTSTCHVHTQQERWDWTHWPRPGEKLPRPCTMPGCTYAHEDPAEDFAAFKAHLLALLADTSKGSARRLSEYRAKHSNAHRNVKPGEHGQPFFDAPDMKSFLVDMLHGLYLNLPKIAWKHAILANCPDGCRELVAEYLKSIGHPLDTRKKDDGRQRESKWFTGEALHSLVAGKRSSPGGPVAFATIIKIIGDALLAAPHVAPEAAAPKPKPKPAAAARRGKRGATYSGFGAPTHARAESEPESNSEDEAPPLPPPPPPHVPTATEHAADAASLALIKGHYGPHARLVINMLLTFDAYFKLFHTLRYKYHEGVSVSCSAEVKESLALAVCQAGLEFQEILERVSVGNHKSFYPHLFSLRLPLLILELGDLWAFSMGSLELLNAVVKRAAKNSACRGRLATTEGTTTRRPIKGADYPKGRIQKTRGYRSSMTLQIMAKLVGANTLRRAGTGIATRTAERLFGGASCGRTKLKSAALPGLANLGKIYLEPDQDSCVEALARLLAAEALE